MKIKCPNCSSEFELDEAVQEKIAAGATEQVEKDMQKKIADAKSKIQQESEEKLIKQQQENEEKLAKELENLENEKKKIKETAEKEISKEKESMQKKIEDELKNEYKNKYAQEIEEALKKNDSEHELKEKEYQEKLRQTEKSLEEAKRRASSGTGQQAGEALELELEEQLKNEFPIDIITEIKKGISGADVSQTVKSNALKEVGIVLWECKNAKWQKSWIEKLKTDVRNAKADIGVIESVNIPPDYKIIEQVSDRIFVVKRGYAIVFAYQIRHQLILVSKAQDGNQLKDKKMQALYKYLIGPEFKARLEEMITGYDILQKELEKEKRAAKTRWAHQEKAIRQMIDGTYSLGGDISGLSGERILESPEEVKKIENLDSKTDVEDLFDEDIEF